MAFFLPTLLEESENFIFSVVLTNVSASVSAAAESHLGIPSPRPWPEARKFWAVGVRRGGPPGLWERGRAPEEEAGTVARKREGGAGR